MSRANPFEGRGRSLAARRRIEAPPMVARAQAMGFWSDLIQRRCGSREAAAVMFDVTFQTACNWWDEMSCPTGDKVLCAIRWWPEEFRG